MQVSIESTGSLGRRMKVALPPDRIEQEFSKRLKRLAGQVRLPGFRPGKVPMKIVEAQYGAKLMQEITDDLIQSTFKEAIGQQGLKPAGGPRFEPQSIERGKQFEYIAEFEVYPEIAKADLAGGKIEKPVCTVTDEDVTRTVENILQQRANWQPVTRAAQTGDRLLIDYETTGDDAPIEGAKAENYALVLGTGSVPGFDENLVGASTDETRSINVNFPSDYHVSVLAGKSVKYEVKIKEVAEPELPEVNEDFIRQFGIKDGNIDTFRAEIMTNLQRQKEQRIREIVKKQVFDTLVKINAIEAPVSLVEQEIMRIHQETQKLAGKAQEPQSLEDTQRETSRAERRVKLGLILSEFIRLKGITADPAQVRNHIEELASEYESKDEFIRWHYENPQRLENIQYLVVEDAAVTALLETAEVTEKHIGFQDLLKMN